MDLMMDKVKVQVSDDKMGAVDVAESLKTIILDKNGNYGSRSKEEKDEYGVDIEIDTAQERIMTPSLLEFGEFYIEGGITLGEGGFGLVTSGTRISDTFPVALKRVKKSMVKSWGEIKGSRRRIPLEIYILSRLSHIEGVIKMLDCFEMESSYVIVTERPESCKDLFDYISDKGILDEEEASDFLRQLVTIVISCYEAGVVHRDIKDENVLVVMDENAGTRHRTLKLIDWGAAAIRQEGLYKDFEGTRVYAPPEWVKDKQYDGDSSTVWSLGVLAFVMVVGEMPFETDSDILNGTLNFRGVALSGQCKDLIKKCLIVDPRKRLRLGEMMNHGWMKKKM